MELKNVSTGGGIAKLLAFNRTAYGIENCFHQLYLLLDNFF